MSVSKDISIELLSSGHVNSYVLFFNLQHTIPEADLGILQKYLIEVEDSYRKTNETAIYESTTKFAQYFQKLDMMELALEYFQNALTAAKKLTKEYHYEVEGTCNLALAIKQEGRLQEALEDFEKARELAKLKEDMPRVQKCSIYLMETFTCIAENFESENKPENSIPIYKKCLELLKEADPNLELKEATDIIFRLGKSFKNMGNIEESVKVLITNFRISSNF
jgi:tetratricopeptide (TPR) repeat protein